MKRRVVLPRLWYGGGYGMGDRAMVLGEKVLCEPRLLGMRIEEQKVDILSLI